MMPTNFLILIAISIASHFAHCKYLTVDLSKLETYGGISVSKYLDASSGIVQWTHEVIQGDVDSIDKIKDGTLVFTKNNRELKDRVVLYGINGDKFIRFPAAKRWFSKSSASWVCWHKDQKKWRRIDCTLFMYVLNRRRNRVVTWDLSLENKFIKTVPLEDKFTKYTPYHKVMVEGVIENGEALWTLAEAGWRQFAYAYQFEKVGLSFFLVAQVSGDGEVSYKALVKGKHSWIPLPSNLSKYFINIAKNIDKPCTKTENPCANGLEIPDSVKNKLSLYINNENEKQEKVYQLKQKEKEEESVVRGVSVDFQYPSVSKDYQLRKLYFVTKNGKFVLAKRNVVFSEATYGPITIFKSDKNSPFLLIYIDYHLKRVLNAFSYHDGDIHLSQYERRAKDWAHVGTDLVADLFYTVDLDVAKSVDKRLISYKREMHLGAYSDVYAANQYIGITSILDDGQIVWKFKTPYRGKIYVTGQGKKRVYAFTFVHDGVFTDAKVKRVLSEYYFKLDDYGKWMKVSHYIKSIS